MAAELQTSGLKPFHKSGLVDAILKNWKDGRKALDWAENQLTGELRCKAVAGALGILVKSEPEAAFGYFEKMTPGETRRQTIRELFSAWGSHDPGIRADPDEWTDTGRCAVRDRACPPRLGEGRSRSRRGVGSQDRSR